MDWKGKINFEKAITLNGKPHGVEYESELPEFDSTRDIGRIVYAEDTGKVWSGGPTDWKELTPGGVGDHEHDDRYYRESEIDDFFEPTVSGKKQVDWSNIINEPTEYDPVVHNNDYHSETYLIDSDITFELLNTNGEVGSTSTQLARGDHDHDTRYIKIDSSATQLSYDNGDSLLSATEVQGAIDELDGRIDYSDNRINNIYWVDNTREDSYSELGNMSRPFRTIASAITAIDNNGGEGSLLLARSTYDTTSEEVASLTIGENISLIAIGGAILNIPLTIGTGSDGTTGSNVVENITFRQPVTVQMNGSTKFSNVVFEEASNLTITLGDAEGDISVNTTADNPALILESGAGEFVGDNCSFSSSVNTILQQGGYLILSNSDIVSATAAGVNSTGGGVLNLSDTRVFNSDGGDAITIENASTSTNPNMLANVFVEGNIDTGSSFTNVQSVSGFGTIAGSNQRYPSSSMLTYDPSTSELESTTVQEAIEELANSHSESQLTTTIYVDANRTYDEFDAVGAIGTIDRPFVDIDSAVDTASSGNTIFCFKGAYTSTEETITLPNNVSLIGVGQGKTNFYSPIETGSSGKCRLEHFSVRDSSLTINETTFINYVFSNSPVYVNAALQGEGFTIQVATGTALTMNSSSDVTLTLNTISTQSDASAIVMDTDNTGAIYLQTSRVENDSETLPTIDSNGGSVALLTTTLQNNNGGPVADFTGNNASEASPNMLSQVFHSGGIIAPTATVVEGVHGGDPEGALILRSATQIGYDGDVSAATVQEAIDQLNGAIGTGNAEDITYTGTLDSTNVAGALDELDAEKSNIGHNHNDLYYTKSDTDNKFVTKESLSDTVTHSLSAAYQEVELTSVSEGDESGLTAETEYFFNISIDDTNNERSIIPDPATQGYQELGLTGIDSTTDTALAEGTYYYQVKVSNNSPVEYDIVIDPATPAEVIGTNDLTNGHDWNNYNADFDITVNGASTTITFDSTLSTIDDIVTRINNQLSDAGMLAEAESYDSGSNNYLGIRTLDTGSTQSFTLSEGTNDALVILGLTADTYTGTDSVPASEDINLNGSAVEGDGSGLNTGTTYDVGVDIDGTSSTVEVLFSEATYAYQELGLSGIDSATDTTLNEDTTYNFLLNDSQYSITTETTVAAVNEETEITFTDDSENSNVAYDGTYFDIYDLTNLYRVWFDVGNTGNAPTDGGGTLVSVSITSGNTADEIASATASELDALTPFSSTSTTSPITVTHDNAGETTDAVDGDSPVTIDILTQGSNEDPADLTWGNTITLLNDATSDDNTPNSGEVYVWEIIGGDVRCTDNDLGGTGIVDLAADSDPDLFTGVGASLETAEDGTDAESTTFSSLLTKLNDNTTGATWSIEGGNIRLTSDTTGAAGSISLSQGTTNDMVDNLSGIVTTDRFINTESGSDATVAMHEGDVSLTDGYDFKNHNEEFVIEFDETTTTYILDSETTTLTDVVTLLNNKFVTGLEAFESSPNVGIRTTSTGSDQYFVTGSNGASGTLGIGTNETYRGTDKTDTTWGNILDLLNASTKSTVIWSIEGGDVRCSYDGTGSESRVELQAGTSGTDFYTEVEVTTFDDPVYGTDATTKFSDIVNHLNEATINGATWTFESGNLRVTRDEEGADYFVEIAQGSTSSVFDNLSGFSDLGTPVEGKDEDTTTGSDLVGVQGIDDIQPIGKNVGEAGTLQEILEGSVGQLRTSEPTTPNTGQAWFDASNNTLWVYNGTTWVSTTLS